jgi:hypothetical protein
VTYLDGAVPNEHLPNEQVPNEQVSELA